MTNTHRTRPVRGSVRTRSRPRPARVFHSPEVNYPNLTRLYQRLGKYDPWRQQAQCRIEGVPPEKFFPYRGESKKVAMEVCSRCPVSAECDEFAASFNSRGIWAGEIRNPEGNT